MAPAFTASPRQQVKDMLSSINMDFLDPAARWLWKNLYGIDGYPVEAYPTATAITSHCAARSCAAAPSCSTVRRTITAPRPHGCLGRSKRAK